MVDSEIIADILQTDKRTVELEAQRLGFQSSSCNPDWQKRDL